MAIEFRCPYCEATIRVADSAPGRVGKCPKCNTKMVVPKPTAAMPPSLPLDFGGVAGPPAVPSASPKAPDDEPVLLEENDTEVPDIQFAPATGAVEPAPLALPTNLVPVIVPAGPIRRVIKKRKTKPPQVMWIIATLMGLGSAIAAGYMVYREAFRGGFDGELIGTALEDPQLPPVTIPRATLTLVSSALEPLLADLEAQPVPLLSELMEVKVGGSKEGLVITVEHGPRTRWYRVDAKSHPRLAAFAKKHEQAWSTARIKKLDQSANAFIRDYQKVRQKEVDSSVMPPYRDSLALSALVKGLGVHTVAVVGTTVYPCVYEQSDGSLYFLLPAKLKSFSLQGKPQGNGQPGSFQGEFRVVVRTDSLSPSETMPMETKPDETTTEPDGAEMEAPTEPSDEPAATKSKKKRKKSSAPAAD